MSKRSRATAFICLGLFASAGANEMSASSTRMQNHGRLIDAVEAADLIVSASNNRALVEWDSNCQDDPNYLSPHFAASCVFHKVVDCKGFTKVGYTDYEVFDLITHCPRSCNVPCGTWTRSPTSIPTSSPTVTHSDVPSSTPSAHPTSSPSSSPSVTPSDSPSQTPTAQPSLPPSLAPSHMPTARPSASPTSHPSVSPSAGPTSQPSDAPTDRPSQDPSSMPSSSPSQVPTARPTSSPTSFPSDVPTSMPSSPPTVMPSDSPSSMPTISQHPSAQPTTMPSVTPSSAPSPSPIIVPVSSRVFEMSLSPVSSYLDTIAYAKLNEAVNDMIMGNMILPDNLGSESRSKMEMSTVLMHQSLARYRVLLEEKTAEESMRRLDTFELRMSFQETLLLTVPALDIPRADGLEYDPSLVPDSKTIDDAIEHLFLDQFQQLALKLRLRVSRIPALSQVDEIKFYGFPTSAPTTSPSMRPSKLPSAVPTVHPTHQHSSEPSSLPTDAPSSTPSTGPTFGPSSTPTVTSSTLPSALPTATVTKVPSSLPTESRSFQPSMTASASPSRVPSQPPTSPPPTLAVSSSPSHGPTVSGVPSLAPSLSPKEILAFGTSFDFHFDGVTSYLDQTSFDAFNEAMNNVFLEQLRAEMYVPAEVQRFEISFTFFYQILGGKQVHNLVESPVKRVRNLRKKSKSKDKKAKTKGINSKESSMSLDMNDDIIEADNRIGTGGIREESPGYLIVRMQMVAHFYVDPSDDERSFVRPETSILDYALSSVLDGGSMRFVVNRLRQTGGSQYKRLQEISLVAFNYAPTNPPIEPPTSASLTDAREPTSRPSMGDAIAMDNVGKGSTDAQHEGWEDSCQDDPSYISTIIPNARCENFQEVDCFAFLSIGVSLDTVSVLVNACPRSCNIECGEFTVFGVANESSKLLPSGHRDGEPSSVTNSSPTRTPSSLPITSSPISGPTVFQQTDDIVGDDINVDGETVEKGKGKGKKGGKKSDDKKSKKGSQKTPEKSKPANKKHSDSGDGGRDFIVTGATGATPGSQIGPKKGNDAMLGFLILLAIGVSILGAMYVKKRWFGWFGGDNDMNGQNAVQLSEIIQTHPNESRSCVSDLSEVSGEKSNITCKTRLSKLFTYMYESKAKSEAMMSEPSGEEEEVMVEDVIA